MDRDVNRIITYLVENDLVVESDVAYARASNGVCLICAEPVADNDYEALVLLALPDGLGEVQCERPYIGQVHKGCRSEERQSDAA